MYFISCDVESIHLFLFPQCDYNATVLFCYLQRQGDAQSHDLPNIYLLHGFHIFKISYEKINFCKKLPCSKVNKSN